MQRTLRNCRVRLHLERLEDRSQPGALLLADLGWSLLGQELAFLTPGQADGASALQSVDREREREAQELKSAGYPPSAPPGPGPTSGPGMPPSSSAGPTFPPPQFVRPLLADLASLRPGDGIWYELTPVPSLRQEISTAALGRTIFVIAGFTTTGQSTSTVEVYFPDFNAWLPAAPLPILNNHNAAAVAGGRLYAFGGVSNRVFAYNLGPNTWSEVAPMNFRHGNTAAVGVINDRIYVAGGDGPGATQTETEVYDPVTNQWTVLARMNVPRNHTAGGVIDGKFYVAGGRGNAASGRAFEVYDPATNRWTMLPSLPTARSGVGAGVLGGRLYVFGGEIPGVFPQVEVYDPAGGTWSEVTSMRTPRHGIFAAVIDHCIYLPSGATRQGLGASNANEAFCVG